jgi:hypothetical protein
MSARMEHELALLRQRWPDLQYTENASGHWVLLPACPVPRGWTERKVDIAFRIPPEPASPPYGFYVRPAILIKKGATTSSPSNYTNAVSEQPPFGDGLWAMFSWSPLNGWHPQDDVAEGDNMTHFARSFADRLKDSS